MATRGVQAPEQLRYQKLTHNKCIYLLIYKVTENIYIYYGHFFFDPAVSPITWAPTIPPDFKCPGPRYLEFIS